MRPLQTLDAGVSSRDSVQLRVNLRNQIRESGYAIVKGRDFLISISARQSWLDFSTTWDDLAEDVYLQQAGFQRLRRYSHLLYDPRTSAITFLPSDTFYQSKSVNPLFGGIKRRFAPMHTGSLQNTFLTQLVALNFKQFPVSDAQAKLNWKVGVHQIRIACKDNRPALPSPEGIHRDGHSFVVMHLMAKHNVLGGISKIYKEEDSLLQSVSLRTAMDSIFVNDTRIMHDVTLIQPAKKDHIATRDVLVLTYDCTDCRE